MSNPETTGANKPRTFAEWVTQGARAHYVTERPRLPRAPQPAQMEAALREIMDDPRTPAWIKECVRCALAVDL